MLGLKWWFGAARFLSFSPYVAWWFWSSFISKTASFLHSFPFFFLLSSCSSSLSLVLLLWIWFLVCLLQENEERWGVYAYEWRLTTPSLQEKKRRAVIGGASLKGRSCRRLEWWRKQRGWVGGCSLLFFISHEICNDFLQLVIRVFSFYLSIHNFSLYLFK